MGEHRVPEAENSAWEWIKVCLYYATIGFLWGLIVVFLVMTVWAMGAIMGVW